MPQMSDSDNRHRAALLGIWNRAQQNMADSTRQTAATNVNRVSQKNKAKRQLEDLDAETGGGIEYNVGDYGNISMRSVVPEKQAPVLDTSRLANDKRYDVQAQQTVGNVQRNITADPKGIISTGGNIEGAMKKATQPDWWTPTNFADQNVNAAQIVAGRINNPRSKSPDTSWLSPMPYTAPAQGAAQATLPALPNNGRVTASTSVRGGESSSTSENMSQSSSIGGASIQPTALMTQTNIQSAYDPTYDEKINHEQIKASLGRIRSQFYSGLGLSEPGEVTAMEASAQDSLKRRDNAVAAFNTAAGGSKMEAVLNNSSYGGGNLSTSTSSGYSGSRSNNNTTSTSVSRQAPDPNANIIRTLGTQGSRGGYDKAKNVFTEDSKIMVEPYNFGGKNFTVEDVKALAQRIGVKKEWIGDDGALYLPKGFSPKGAAQDRVAFKDMLEMQTAAKEANQFRRADENISREAARQKGGVQYDGKGNIK